MKKFCVTAIMTVATIGTTYGTANAAPPAQPGASAPAPAISAHGEDHGVMYTVDRGADGKTLTAAVTGGRFDITADAITVLAGDGARIARFPLRLRLGKNQVTLSPRVRDHGTKLAAEVAASPVGHWRKTSPHGRSIRNGFVTGLMVGAIAGAILGTIVGIATLGLLLPFTLGGGVVFGAAAGAAIGAIAGALAPKSTVPDRWEEFDNNDDFNNDDYSDCLARGEEFPC